MGFKQADFDHKLYRRLAKAIHEVFCVKMKAGVTTANLSPKS
jgi:hypothetical protein